MAHLFKAMEKDEISQIVDEGQKVEQNRENFSIKTAHDKPWITIFIGLICIVLFIGINLESNINSWDTFFKWGAPSANDIWNGHIWGLITSNFLHHDFLHLIFNLYWLWIFGDKIELQLNKLFYLFLLLSSGFITSTLQLTLSDSTGIGFSGIVYAMFGFIFIKSKLDKSNNWQLEQKTTILFIFWLFFCIILTYAKVWMIGNVSHFSGLLWGIFIGYLSTVNYKSLKIALPIFIICISSITLAWSPWSVGWLSNKAYNLHKNQDLKQAEFYYSKILEKDSNNVFAIDGLKQLKIYDLSRQAENYYNNNDLESARKKINEILKIDPNNEWAKQVDSIIP